MSLFSFEGIEEYSKHFVGYIQESAWENERLEFLQQVGGLISEIEEKIIPPQNWNKTWEANFKPIYIKDKWVVRAEFHEPQNRYPEILINPKMAFGTGHHATTYLMLDEMHKELVANKKVLDYGCGTGILSIAAEKLGGMQITGIDIEDMAILNSKENVVLNNCHEIVLFQGDLDVLSNEPFDLILANINKHVICNNINALYNRLIFGGKLLISGILAEFEEEVSDVILSEGFHLEGIRRKDDWLLYHCNKV